MKVSRKVGRRSRSSISRRRLRNKKSRSGYRKKHTQRGGKRGRGQKRMRARTYKRGRRFHRGGVTDAFLHNLDATQKISYIKNRYAIIKDSDEFTRKLEPYFFQRENRQTNTFDVTTYHLYTYDKEGLKSLVTEKQQMNCASPIITLKCKKKDKSSQFQKFSCSITYSRNRSNDNLIVSVTFKREDDSTIDFSFFGTPDEVDVMLKKLTNTGITKTSSKKNEEYSFSFPENEDMFKAIANAVKKYEVDAEQKLTKHSERFIKFSSEKNNLPDAAAPVASASAPDPDASDAAPVDDVNND